MSKRAGIYVRVSTEYQAGEDKASVPNQVEQCKAMCERQSYLIADTYIDAENYVATYGKNKGKMIPPSSKRKDRPEYQRLVKDIREGKVEVVVAWKWDRLGAGGGIYPLMDALNEAPVTIETCTEGPIPELMLSMLASFRAQVLRDMHDRIIMGGKARLEAGKRMNGYRCFGYDYDPEIGRRRINEEEAKWVSQIFDWYAIDCLNIRTIRKRLIKESVPQKMGQAKWPWAESHIRGMLRNSSYTGKATVKWDGEVHEVPCPPIVDEQVFEMAQKRLDKNNAWRDHNKKLPYLLSGMLRCGECNGLWRATGMRYRYKDGQRFERETPLRYYRCRFAEVYPESCSHKKPINADWIESLVWAAAVKTVKDPQFVWVKVKHRIAELKANKEERIKEAEKLERKLENLKEQRLWCVTQARKGTITQADFEAQIAMLGTEQTETEIALREAKAEIPGDTDIDKMKQLFEVMVAKQRERLEWLNDPPKEDWKEAMEVKREIIEALFDEVVIYQQGEKAYKLKIKGGPLFKKSSHIEIDVSRCA